MDRLNRPGLLAFVKSCQHPSGSCVPDSPSPSAAPSSTDCVHRPAAAGSRLYGSRCPPRTTCGWSSARVSSLISSRIGAPSTLDGRPNSSRIVWYVHRAYTPRLVIPLTWSLLGDRLTKEVTDSVQDKKLKVRLILTPPLPTRASRPHPLLLPFARRHNLLLPRLAAPPRHRPFANSSIPVIHLPTHLPLSDRPPNHLLVPAPPNPHHHFLPRPRRRLSRPDRQEGRRVLLVLGRSGSLRQSDLSFYRLFDRRWNLPLTRISLWTDDRTRSWERTSWFPGARMRRSCCRVNRWWVGLGRRRGTDRTRSIRMRVWRLCRCWLLR